MLMRFYFSPLLSVPIFSFLFLFTLPVLAHEITTSPVIHMTDTGFEPKTITVSKGTEVTFENTGKKPHWPIITINPTYSYPAFDAKKEIVTGEEWKFTFDRVGTWNFHDFTNPSLTGVIIVTEKVLATSTNKIGFWTKISSPFTSSWTFITSLFSTKRKIGSLEPLELKNAQKINPAKTNMFNVVTDEDQLANFLKAFGPKVAMEKLLSDSGGGATLDCHQQAHKIGRMSYTLYGAGVFGLQNAANCNSGFYHGAMEAFLAEKGTANLAQNIESICKILPTGLGIFECLHGVGHGIMAYTNYDLPKTLATCDNLSTLTDRLACYSGVFMENILTAQGIGASSEHTTSWINNNPQFPCNSIGEDYLKRYQCFERQTSWMLTLFNNNFDKVAEECLKAPKDMIGVCFKSMGRDAAEQTLHDPLKTKAICDKNKNYFNDCIAGALIVFVNFWGENLKGQASGFCTVLNAENKFNCYKILAGRIPSIALTPERRSEICTTFEKNYQYLCAR